jgi:hypothetical protein
MKPTDFKLKQKELEEMVKRGEITLEEMCRRAKKLREPKVTGLL